MAIGSRVSEQGPVAMELEIFLCERYLPLSGWSSDYLLPTDQHAYRLRGKKGGFNKITEAEEAMLAPGWVWGELRWQVDPGGQPADSEGWSYGMNFNSTFEGSGKSGMQMFTRWQRLVRTQTFGGVSSLEQCAQSQPYTCCPNLDLFHAEQVGRNLQEAIAASSLYADYNLHSLVKLKQQLLERLAPARPDKLSSLEGALNDFIGSQRPMSSRLTQVFKGAGDSEVTARVQEVGLHFLQAERDAYAALAIRRFRPDQACRAGRGEQHECPFAAVHCEHKGCSECFSVHALPAHDAVCLFKVLACEKCDEKLPRGQLQRHMLSACSMRDAACCFSAIGCNKPLTHRDVSNHLDECTQAHMLLLLQTVTQQQSIITEQQAVIQSLTARVSDLEGTRMATGIKLAELETNMGKALNDNVAKALKDATAAAEKKAGAAGADARKHADGAVATLRGELASVRSELGTVKTSVGSLNTKLEPIFSERKK